MKSVLRWKRSLWSLKCLLSTLKKKILAELSDEERPSQQRLPGSLRQPLPVQLRPPLCNQNRVQWGHRWNAQHPKEISSGRSPSYHQRYRRNQKPERFELTHACKWRSTVGLNWAALCPVWSAFIFLTPTLPVNTGCSPPLIVSSL